MDYKILKDLKKSPEEEKILWENYSKAKNLENRNKLIEHYLYLLIKPVKNIHATCKNTHEESDIFQSAVIGLAEAIEMFSHDKNTQFKTFSRWRIHGSIIDYLRKSGLISLPYNVRKNINQEREQAHENNLNFENPYYINSLDALDENENTRGFAESLQADLSNQPEILTEDKIMLEEVYKILGSLPEEESQTIINYYLEGRTLEQIAKKLNMTRSGVWQLRKRAIENIRERLEA